MTEKVKEAFMNHSWPGNVRELRNMIESGFNLCESDYIDLKDIDSDMLFIRGKSIDISDERECENNLKQKMKKFEKHIIRQALIHCKSQTKAAELLGISRQTLNNKIKDLNISESLDGE